MKSNVGIIDEATRSISNNAYTESLTFEGFDYRLASSRSHMFKALSARNMWKYINLNKC